MNGKRAETIRTNATKVEMISKLPDQYDGAEIESRVGSIVSEGSNMGRRRQFHKIGLFCFLWPYVRELEFK